MTIYINRQYKSDPHITVAECETFDEIETIIDAHNIAEPDKDVLFWYSTIKPSSFDWKK